MKHPASGYVQGINDLLMPYFMVYLKEMVPDGSVLDTFPLSTLGEENLDCLEADCFWWEVVKVVY